ncbi:MAG TPA: 50S ribosomal protein L35 [Candidatus Eisenbacteria bacterium]|jgi:large subunit ribosomal protein L35|nr:50S ribosomal protein L35 [Candidatus Eisenbacteria bacterium]
MPKLKTNKSVQKRFRKSKSGKFMKMRAGKRHLNMSKSTNRKRHLRESDMASTGMSKQLRRLMPYA